MYASHTYTTFYVQRAPCIYLMLYIIYVQCFFGMDAIPQLVEFSVPTAVHALPAEVASILVSHYKITPM